MNSARGRPRDASSAPHAHGAHAPTRPLLLLRAEPPGRLACYSSAAEIAKPPPGIGDVISVSAAVVHACAVTAAGRSAACWPSRVLTFAGEPVNMTAPDDLGPVLQVAAGGSWAGSFSCALTAARAVRCWGYNLEGVLNVPGGIAGRAASVSAGNAHVCAVLLNNTAVCWGKLSLALHNVTGAAAGGGEGQACFVTTRQELVCAGADPHRASGVPPADLGPVVQAGAPGPYHGCAVAAGGAARCWGNGDYFHGIDGLRGVRSVAVGEVLTCAITRSGGLRCAQREASDPSLMFVLPPASLAAPGSALAVAAGYNFACAIVTKCGFGGRLMDEGAAGFGGSQRAAATAVLWSRRRRRLPASHATYCPARHFRAPTRRRLSASDLITSPPHHCITSSPLARRSGRPCQGTTRPAAAQHMPVTPLNGVWAVVPQTIWRGEMNRSGSATDTCYTTKLEKACLHLRGPGRPLLITYRCLRLCSLHARYEPSTLLESRQSCTRGCLLQQWNRRNSRMGGPFPNCAPSIQLIACLHLAACGPGHRGRHTSQLMHQSPRNSINASITPSSNYIDHTHPAAFAYGNTHGPFYPRQAACF